MYLYELLQVISYKILSGTDMLSIEQITWGSRDASPQSLFIAVKGQNIDLTLTIAPPPLGGPILLPSIPHAKREPVLELTLSHY